MATHLRKQAIPLIFLADDDEDDIFLFREAMTGTGLRYNLRVEMDGDRLMYGLTEIYPVKPDVIFLDINMPKKNGFEVLQQIKSSYLSAVPVFLLSTAENDFYIDTARRLGATGYLSKPQLQLLYSRTLSDVLSINWAGKKPYDFYIHLDHSLARN
jgi:CheY-like chemotaxis protein